MIASLIGTVTRILFDSVIIDVSGVGYRVFATPGTLANLTCGSTETLLTELVVREDDLTLYGFVDGNEQDLFILLQKTSGIGPKMALSILSVFTPEDLCRALSQEDIALLQKVPGVGKKVAQRLVVELKDKVDAVAVQPTGVEGTPTTSSVAVEVEEALTGLGFSAREAENAISSILKQQTDADTSTVLRKALAYLGARS